MTSERWRQIEELYRMALDLAAPAVYGYFAGLSALTAGSGLSTIRGIS
jgi:hypothetical protein